MHAKPVLRVFRKWKITRPGSVITDVIRLDLSPGRLVEKMKPPTNEQRNWATEGFAYTAQCFDEWTREGVYDYSPMLRLLDHIRSLADFDAFSVWKSLATLTISSASHVMPRYNLISGAPSLGITQEDSGFVLSCTSGKNRQCCFDDVIEVLDVELLGLKMKIDEFESATGG